MVDRNAHQPNILVIAAWPEAHNLRARVTLSDPDHVSGRSSVVVDDRDQLVDVVTTWFDRVKDSIRSEST